MTLVRPSKPQNIFLHPGEFHFGAAPGKIGTLLGSCVALTVWHPASCQGGMCHILLPSRSRPPGANPDCRYAWDAVERLAQEVRRRGIDPVSCLVHMYGGGNMFCGTAAESINVGRKNLEATRMAVAHFGFCTAYEHVGGDQPRRLTLDLGNGSVHLALTKPAH